MSQKKQAHFQKKTLNLVFKDRPPHYYRAIIIGTLIGVLLIGAFTKFAVIDRMNAAYALQYEADGARGRYEQFVQANAAFEEVRAEYEKYFTRMNDSETYVDCMDVVSIIEDTLMASAAVQSATLSDNVLSVILTGIDLEQASAIVKALYTNDLVGSAAVSSADTTSEEAESFVAMTITLLPEGEKAQ